MGGVGARSKCESKVSLDLSTDLYMAFKHGSMMQYLIVAPRYVWVYNLVRHIQARPLTDAISRYCGGTAIPTKQKTYRAVA